MIDLGSIFSVTVGGANGAIIPLTDSVVLNTYFTMMFIFGGVSFVISMVVKTISRS